MLSGLQGNSERCVQRAGWASDHCHGQRKCYYWINSAGVLWKADIGGGWDYAFPHS